MPIPDGALSRRDLIAALAASPQAVVQTGNLPATPAEELERVRAQRRRDQESLERFDLAMSIEPAFRFEA